MKKTHKNKCKFTNFNVSVLVYSDINSSVSIAYRDISSLSNEGWFIGIEIINDNIARLSGDI